jgi:PRTRC genetic system protein B
MLSPYRSALPPDLDVEEDPLRLRLDFHDESVILHDFAEKVTRTRLVSTLDVAHALARELDLDTGLLPPETLWWAKTAIGVRVAVWREPKVWTIRLRERYDAQPRRLRLPMPGLAFVCLPGRQPPYVFAAKTRPTATTDVLYRCPTYNVFDTGRVCTGSHDFPADAAKVPEAFFESYFSAVESTGRSRSRQHPDDIGALWTELRGHRSYPLEDLVPHGTVADVMRIGQQP